MFTEFAPVASGATRSGSAGRAQIVAWEPPHLLQNGPRVLANAEAKTADRSTCELTGWFSSAAYLTNERRNHMLEMMMQAKK